MRTTESFPQIRRLLIGAVLALSVPCTALADEQKPPAKPFDVKKDVFGTICGYCHGDYGRAASKGPQLMNSERTDEYLYNIIHSGKPGKMAAFGILYTDDQIHQIVKFIRNLKPDEEPQNP
ncbi:MAG: cytochrome c [Pseudomonadota bacterium]